MIPELKRLIGLGYTEEEVLDISKKFYGQDGRHAVVIGSDNTTLSCLTLAECRTTRAFGEGPGRQELIRLVENYNTSWACVVIGNETFEFQTIMCIPGVRRLSVSS
jgi:hypothetical protein